jgi:hypothetical protein
VRSLEGGRRWELRLRGRLTRVYELQASLASLRAPFVPCTVTLDGRPLRRRSWRYDSARRALELTFRARSARLVARACPRSGP